MIQLSKPTVEQLLKLLRGESVPSSSFKGEIADEMLDNDVLVPIVHGRRKTYKVVSSCVEQPWNYQERSPGCSGRETARP